MPALSTPQDILTTEIKEIYSAERQLSRTLPRIMKKVSSDRLREMLQQRLEQGETLIEQLDDALEEMDVPKSRPKNVAAEGLIEDANHQIEQLEDGRLLDPVLLASVQKLEHYCIAAWGTAASMGRLLGEEKIVQCMEQVLDEGKRFDEEMTKLAEEEINPAMMSAAEEGEEEEEETGGRRAARSSGKKSSRKS